MGKGVSTFELIVIGNEVLNGTILDSNSNWLAARLYELGVRVRRITAVRDELGEVATVIREAIKRDADWIITSGGLGPTFDDLTLQGVAKALRRPLVLNKHAVEMLRQRYSMLRESGLIESDELTPSRLKMAMLPKGAKPLRNRVGSAPGVLLRVGKTWIACLPGVPAELRDIYENELKPLIIRKCRKVVRDRRWVLVKGMTESALAPHIDEVRSKHREVYIKSHPQGIEDGVSKIVLEFLCESGSMVKASKGIDRAVSEMVKKLRGLGISELSISGEKPI